MIKMGNISPPLVRAKPPWKSLWKGPLPPARVTPTATLGDFLPPAGQGAAARNDAPPPPAVQAVLYTEPDSSLCFSWHPRPTRYRHIAVASSTGPSRRTSSPPRLTATP
jgi:hypothetical protein